MIPEEVNRSLSSDKCSYELSIATTLENQQRRLAYAHLELARADLQSLKPDVDVDYGSLQLLRVHLPRNDGNKLLEQLYGGQQLALETLTGFSPFRGQTPPVQFFSSKAMYRNNRAWPINYSEFTSQDQFRAGLISRVLSKPGFPLYPSSQEAIGEFFELGTGQNFVFNDYGKLSLVFPDYRARISEFRIGYERVSLSAAAGDAKAGDLRCKFYAAGQSKSRTSADLKLDSGTATFAPGFDPTRVLAVLFDARDGSMIDQRDWYAGFVNPEYAKVERPEQQIRDLIAAGEGKTIEFKGSIANDKDEFLETVVAFSNSEGGLILLGINNNRMPIGFKGDKDAILQLIRDSCEPAIEPAFKEYVLENYPILVVEIPIGQDKPYMLKHKGIVYIRVGPNDVPASRLDLDQLTNQNGTGRRTVWS